MTAWIGDFPRMSGTTRDDTSYRNYLLKIHQMRRIFLILTYPFFRVLFGILLTYANFKFVVRRLFGKEKISVRKHFSDGIDDMSRIAIFSIYYTHMRSHLTVADLLRANGYSIVLVSNRELSESEVHDYSKFVDAIVERSNIGYDFGAYKEGIRFLGQAIDRCTDLILANDSVYYFSHSVEILNEVLEAKFDVSSVTANHNRFHLQSYFLRFRGKTSAVPFAVKWFDEFKIRHGKIRAIKKGEVALSRSLIRNGLQIGEVVTPARVTEMLSGKLLEFERRFGLNEDAPMAKTFEEIQRVDDEVIYNGFIRASGLHIFNVSLSLQLGVPMKLDLNEVYPAALIIRSLSNSRIGVEYEVINEWFRRRLPRGVGEHGLERSFAVRNIR